MPAYFREMPPYVSQSSTYLCWAAALESWLRAVPTTPIVKQAQLVADAKAAGVTDSRGALFVKKGMLWIKSEYQMGLKVFQKKQRLTATYALERLKKQGYLFLAWNSIGDVGHAQVIWGVNTKHETLAYMDPWPGMGYNSQTLAEYYYEPAEFIVGFPP